MKTTRRSLRARRVAEDLFRRLDTPTYVRQGQHAAQIIYPERFRLGHCVIGVLIPVGHEKVEFVTSIGVAQQRYHHAPAVINSRSRRCLRLAYRFKKIRPKERDRVYLYATMLSDWVKETFNVSSVMISPVGGLIQAKWRLRLLTR